MALIYKNDALISFGDVLTTEERVARLHDYVGAPEPDARDGPMHTTAFRRMQEVEKVLGLQVEPDHEYAEPRHHLESLGRNPSTRRYLGVRIRLVEEELIARGHPLPY